MDILQITLVIIFFIVLIIPVGNYLYKVINIKPCKTDGFFNMIDNFIYKITGIDKKEMGWKEYTISLLATNMIMLVITYILLRIQGGSFFNPNKAGSMEQSVSFNTAISFLTNTNLQHYAGETGLSYLNQMIVITFFMVTSGATGVAAAAAFIRGITQSKKELGNFYVDFVRIITRVLIPFSIVVSLLLVSQGVPQTLSQNKVITTIEGKIQTIGLGPVASLESIKHLGTNGGGFFGANSCHPFENPTPITNVIEMISMMLIPGALVYCFGKMVKNKKQGLAIFLAMAIIFLISLPVCYISEKAGNPNLASIGLSQAMGNMEGKELRLGVAQSSLFTTVTTAFTTGSVNNMHDSLTPLGGMVAMWGMMLNCIFGGEGVGFMNIIMYAILTVFLCGLMVGRSPEFLGKKIEGREMKLIALCILVHPFIILIPSAIALIIPQGVKSITNSGFHGLSQIIYEFASSAANNGSGFEGLVDNNFWNVSTGLVMLLGRYLSMIILLAVAGSLSSKKAIPETAATFRTDNAMFTITLVFIVLIIGALTFLPALALGPVAEYLTLYR